MIEKYRATGYTLYEPFDNKWVIDCNDGHKYYGSFKEVVNFMCKELLFDLDEVTYGMDAMLKADNNAMHFGINRTFIYSYNKDVSDVSKAS